MFGDVHTDERSKVKYQLLILLFTLYIINGKTNIKKRFCWLRYKDQLF
jgi:hypothetical protein